MFSVRNLQINRGTTTANAQGQFTSAQHSYKDKSQTLAAIISSFPAYFGQGATQDEIFLNDLIRIIGSDGVSEHEILNLNPVTLGPDLYLGSSFSLLIGAPIAPVDANALRFNANILQAEFADGTNPGVVSTTTQTFAGAKTFSGGVLTNNINSATAGPVTIGNLAGTTAVTLSKNTTVAAGQTMQSNTYNATTGGGTIQVGTNASLITTTPLTGFNNGVYFPSTSGDVLNYYSTQVVSLQFENAGNFTGSVDINALRIGRMVVLQFVTEATGTAGGNAYFQSSGSLPGQFVPIAADVYGFFTSYDSGFHAGAIRIDTSGNIFIYRDADQSTGYSTGNGGFGRGSIAYITN